MTDALTLFSAHRPRLFGIAYRMLGSATDAEDVLQDAWLRWSGVDHASVAEPGAFLARTVINLCRTALQSARARREVYVGPWLPEPVLTGPGSELGPLEDAVARESVSFALLAVLERLSPAERAVYVLREAFQHRATEVAALLGTSEANVRQLHTRARRHVTRAQLRPVDQAAWQSLVGRFLAAAREGDVAGLERLLAADAVARSDGGGVVSAARRPVVGRQRVARYAVGVLQRFTQGLETAVREVNGGSAVVATREGRLQAVWFAHTRDGLVTGIDAVLNPDKLTFAAAQLSRVGGPGR